MLVDPLSQRQPDCQPRHRVEVAFLVDQVPAVGDTQAAGGEPVSGLSGVVFGDADQQLAQGAQRGTHVAVQFVEPGVDVGDRSAAYAPTAGWIGGHVGHFIVNKSHCVVVVR